MHQEPMDLQDSRPHRAAAGHGVPGHQPDRHTGGGHQGTDRRPKTNDGTRGRECEWAESLNCVT